MLDANAHAAVVIVVVMLALMAERALLFLLGR